MRFGKLLFPVILLWHSCAAAGELPRPIRYVIDGHKIPSGSYAIYVRETGKTEPLLSVNPEMPMNPASAIKIVPTLAALELLKPSFRWKTEVYTLGKVDNGVLEGDILFKGYGDPHLVTEEFRKMLEELKRRGISKITGDFLIDNTYFAVPHGNPGAFDNRPFRTYNVGPDAFLVNFKTVHFHFYPGGNNGGVMVYPEPELAGLTIDNRLRLRKRYCGGFQRGVALTIPDAQKADHVIFSGRFPSGCDHYIMPRTVLTHETFAFGLFKSLWRQLGGTISGRAGAASAPQEQAPFLVWYSKPLSDVVKLINKFSNNVMSRQLLLTLGAELREPPGTTEKGVSVINEYSGSRGLDTTTLKIDNGAGLSRTARASARFLADLLEYGWTISYRPEFVSSLSIVGIDGTAKNRLKYKQAASHAHIKTGTINGVSAIAGYVHAKSGRHYVVSGLLNHKQAHRGPGKELMNALVIWTYNQ